MPIAKCPRCSATFNKDASPVCGACQPTEDKDFEKVRNILLASSTKYLPAEVAEAAEVEVAVVLRMLSQGVITSTALHGEKVSCGRCGAPAISLSQRLCQACLEKLNAEAARAQAKLRQNMAPSLRPAHQLIDDDRR